MAPTHLTEAAWLAGDDAKHMLASLEDAASIRKLRLLAVAAMRRLWGRLTEAERLALDTLEQFADGRATLADMERCRSKLADPRSEYWGVFDQVLERIVDPRHARSSHLASGVLTVLHEAIYVPGHYSSTGNHSPAEWARREEGNRRTVEAIRDIFGNPYRSIAIEPAWLHWNGGTVPAVARAIYDERRFDHLPILGDALEEAGCCNEQILLHCRAPGIHFRGCWLIDLLLDRT